VFTASVKRRAGKNPTQNQKGQIEMTVTEITQEIEKLSAEANFLTSKSGFTTADKLRCDYIFNRTSTLRSQLKTASTTDADRAAKDERIDCRDWRRQRRRNSRPA
jgi:hypothetical protein